MCLFNKDVVRYASELDQLDAIIIYSVPDKSALRRCDDFTTTTMTTKTIKNDLKYSFIVYYTC